MNFETIWENIKAKESKRIKNISASELQTELSAKISEYESSKFGPTVKAYLTEDIANLKNALKIKQE